MKTNNGITFPIFELAFGTVRMLWRHFALGVWNRFSLFGTSFSEPRYLLWNRYFRSELAFEILKSRQLRKQFFLFENVGSES